MRDINTTYRDEVTAANAAMSKSIKVAKETLTKAMDLATAAYDQEIRNAVEEHLSRVTAAEIAWAAAATEKLKAFQGEETVPEKPKLPKAKKFGDDLDDPVTGESIAEEGAQS